MRGAFDVRAGKLFGFVSEDHDALTFLDLLDVVDTCYPTGRGHIICDNLSAHDTDDVLDWLDDHPRWQRQRHLDCVTPWDASRDEPRLHRVDDRATAAAGPHRQQGEERSARSTIESVGAKRGGEAAAGFICDPSN